MSLQQILLFWLLFLLLFHTCYGQTRTFDVAVAGGAVHNFRTPLHIYQKPYSTIKLDAAYATEPFNPPVYYDIRVNTLQHEKGWELKFTHHKLILKNLPLEVQRFSITNGFNLLTLNRLWLTKGLTWSVGGGLVITHPESTVRGKSFSENKGIFNKGYYISGPMAEAAISKRLYLGSSWFMLAEARFTGAYVEVPIADGEADLFNAAFHVLLGFGHTIHSTGTSKTAKEQ